MSVVGTVESVWRYPVKSMRGEELNEIFAGYAGVYGDRLFAFTSSASPKGFPFFTGREQRQMIRYRARYRDPEKAAQPANWSEAKSFRPRSIRSRPSPADLMIDVETPDGKTFAIDDPELIEHSREHRRQTPAHLASLGKGPDRLSSALDLCRAIRAKTWGRNGCQRR